MNCHFPGRGILHRDRTSNTKGETHHAHRTSIPGFAAVAICAVGCGSSKPKDMIVGTWEVIEPQSDADAKAVYEFKPDGTLLSHPTYLGKKSV
jgi:hypothetical protein